MEYMLMPDGSVSVHGYTDGMSQVQARLKIHNGVAYYWLFSQEWMMSTPGDKTGRQATEVPSVVLLAHAIAN